MSGYNSNGKKLLLIDSAWDSLQSKYFESSIKPHIDKSIDVIVVKDPKKAAKELSTGHYPLALLEHWLLCGFVHEGLIKSFIAGIAGKIISRTRQYDAYKLLPGFIEASPETKYIITCHGKGSGIGKEKTFYDPYPQVLKTMGWLYTKANAEYVIRKIRDIYLK